MARRNKYMKPSKYGGGGATLTDKTLGVVGSTFGIVDDPYQIEGATPAVLKGMAAGAATGGLPGAIAGGAGAFYTHVEDRKALKGSDLYMPEAAQVAYNTPTFCRGGKVKKYPTGGLASAGTAEVERGEVLRYPDGNIQIVSDKAPKHGQKAKSGLSGVRMDLPEGTEILSSRNVNSKTRMPYSAPWQERVKLKDKSLEQYKTGGKYAKNSAKLNLQNINKAFTKDFTSQEKSMKRDPVTGMKYAKGGQVPKYGGEDQWQSQIVGANGSLLLPQWVQRGGDNWSQKNTYGEFTPSIENIAYAPNVLGNQVAYAGGYSPSSYNMSEEHTYTSPDSPYTGVPLRTGWADYIPKENTTVPNTPVETSANQPVTQPTSVGNTMQPPSAPIIGQLGGAPLEAFGTPFVPQTSLPGSTPAETLNIARSTETPYSPSSGSSFNDFFNDGLGKYGSLLGVGMNIAQGLRKPTQRDPKQFTNPYASQARNAMRNRRFNDEALKEANRVAAAVARKNLEQSGASAGQIYSGTQGLAAGRMRADLAVDSQRQNMNNQYLAQQASMDATLGAQEAANRYRTDQDNLAAQAVRRNYQGRAATDAASWFQMQQLMANQQLTDEMRTNIFRSNPYGAKWLGLPTV